MKASKSNLAQKLHHGFVWGCIGLTVFYGVVIGLKGWEYLLYVRPGRKAEEAKYEQELLKEGKGFTSSTSEEIPA